MSAKKKYDKGFLRDTYFVLCKTRYFEEAVTQVYQNGLMPGLSHVYLGEEAIATGACAAVGENDLLASTHRGHGHICARGADVNRMMAEIMGKADGYCRGKGGSMHIAAVDKGMLGANGIVGGGIPIATGAAYQAMYKKTGQVVLAFFGDGASNEGVFHESVNMASAWNLPIVFILENNMYGISTKLDRISKVTDLSVRAQGYGMPGAIVDGQDTLAVYEAVKEAADRARAGEGPTLLEFKTYRFRGHFVGDGIERVVPQDEIDSWRAKDPLKIMAQYMLDTNMFTEQEIEEVHDEAHALIDASVDYAKACPFPTPEQALEDYFV